MEKVINKAARRVSELVLMILVMLFWTNLGFALAGGAIVYLGIMFLRSLLFELLPKCQRLEFRREGLDCPRQLSLVSQGAVLFLLVFLMDIVWWDQLILGFKTLVIIAFTW